MRLLRGFVFLSGVLAHEYKLEPDLFTLGKIVGGGLPIGVLCGDKDIMSLCNPVGKDKSDVVCYVGGGTFAANPLTMTAGLATLRYLKQNKSAIYPSIDKIGQRIRKGLEKVFSDSKIDVDITGVGSLFMTHFLNNNVRKISSALDVGLSNKDLLRKYHFALIAKHNIFFLPEKMGAISSSHTLKDAELLIDATQQIIQSHLFSRDE